jgi:hypothetical protein
MVTLCGLSYDQTMKKQSKQLLAAIMNRTAGHPAAFGAAQR